MTEPVDPVIDLVDRTLTNLQLIDEMSIQRSPGRRPFEVTQLVNSLLSLLVVPRELGTVDFVGKASVGPHVYPDGIRAWHQGPVRFDLTGFDMQPPVNLRKLLGGLRNSVAHANFQYVSDARDVITAIEFMSTSNTKVPLWSATFEIAELRMFLVNLSHELKSARQRQLSEAKRPASRAKELRRTVEFELPVSTLERIDELVATKVATSRGRFLQDAAEAKLRDDEDLTAA